MQRLPGDIEFRDPARARLDSSRRHAPERILARIQMLLASVAGPDGARRATWRVTQESPAAFDRIASSPAALRLLIAIFSYSASCRNDPAQPGVHPASGESGIVAPGAGGGGIRGTLLEFLGADPAVPGRVDLARFRRRQILRIVLRDVLGAGAFADVTEELSNLADAILGVAYRRIRADLVRAPRRTACTGGDGRAGFP